MKKTCPKCQAEVQRVAKMCACGHVFSAKVRSATRKSKATTPPVDQTAPDFACGPDSDGGLLLFWPKKCEAITLTKAERDLLTRALLVLTPGSAAG